MAAPLVHAVLHRLHSLAELGQEERIAAWRTAWAMWSDHPWLGVGLDNLPALWFRYADPALPRGLLFSRAHAEPLHVLVSTGLLGLAVWTTSVALLARAAISRARTDADTFAPVIAALAAFSAVVAPGFHVVPTASLAAVCAGVLMGGWGHGGRAVDRRRIRR